MSDKNWLAYQFYLQIKAGRRMPDDSIVQRNCGLIRWVEDSMERAHQGVMRTLFTSLQMLKR